MFCCCYGRMTTPVVGAQNSHIKQTSNEIGLGRRVSRGPVMTSARLQIGRGLCLLPAGPARVAAVCRVLQADCARGCVLRCPYSGAGTPFSHRAAVPSCPVPSHPVPSRPDPSRPVPTRPVLLRTGLTGVWRRSAGCACRPCAFCAATGLAGAFFRFSDGGGGGVRAGQICSLGRG